MNPNQCQAITRKGHQCPINANPGSPLCHVHDPTATFQQQQKRRREQRPPRPNPTRQVGDSVNDQLRANLPIRLTDAERWAIRAEFRGPDKLLRR